MGVFGPFKPHHACLNKAVQAQNLLLVAVDHRHKMVLNSLTWPGDSARIDLPGANKEIY